MQNAKDSFYVALRDRLAAINPQRTVVLRGIQRPGILVQEAESATSALPENVFVLTWSALSLDISTVPFLAKQTCVIRYATSGTATASGLDRGRVLAEMDCELLAMLSPAAMQKWKYTVTPAEMLSTQVFWNAPTFSSIDTERDELSRAVSVDIYSFEEPGEL